MVGDARSEIVGTSADIAGEAGAGFLDIAWGEILNCGNEFLDVSQLLR